MEKLIEKDYKENDFIAGTDYRNNILLWNCRGIWSNKKINFVAEKLIEYQPVIAALIDSKNYVSFYGYFSYFVGQNLLLIKNGYNIKPNKYELLEKEELKQAG